MQPAAAATAPSSGLPFGARRRANDAFASLAESLDQLPGPSGIGDPETPPPQRETVENMAANRDPDDEPGPWDRADDMTPEDWRGLTEGLLKLLSEEASEPEHAEDDAGPRYFGRRLVNGDAVSEWARKLGFRDVVPGDQMKVAVGFSRDRAATAAADAMTVPDADGQWNGTRSLERLRMDGSGPVVLRFASPDLMARRRELDDSAKYKPEDRPYVVVAGDPGDVDLGEASPYGGPLDLGPEEVGPGDDRYGTTGQVIFVSRKGKVLFLRRAAGVPEAGEWDLPGGHVEAGEDAQTAARREALEETGVPPPTAMRLVDQVSFDGEDHTTFAAEVGKRFKPALSEEHVDWKWVDPRKPPQPLRPIVAAALAAMQKGALAPGPVAEEHFGAAVMYVEPDGRVLFLKRGHGEHAGRWDLPGGRAEDGEEPEETAAREAAEESGREPGKLKLVDKGPPLAGAKDKGYFATFAARAPQFKPTISDEHSDHVWAHPSRPPRPLHPGVAAVLTRVADAQANDAEDPPGAAVDPDAGGTDPDQDREPGVQRAGPNASPDQDADPTVLALATDTAQRLLLAFDRSPSREYDRDGRLHVDGVNICREGVSPYVGHEVPNWQELGLEPDRIYKFYRPADELEKAIATSNGIPVLRKHKAVSAKDHDHWVTVGSIGTRGAWKQPFITNDISVWPAADIEGVESKEKTELSPGYHYKPLMRSGTFDGEDYDGVMTDICFNHVAIVETGRQGPEVTLNGDDGEEIFWASLGQLLRESAA